MRSSLLERHISFSRSAVLTDSQLQLDAAVHTLTEEASHPLGIAAMVGGSFVFRGSNLVLSRLASPLLAESGLFTRVLAQTTIRALSLGTEVATFRSISQGPASIFEGRSFATDYLSFGILKGVGRLAQGQSVPFTHFLQSGGMVAGHNLAYGLGLSTAPQGSLVEQFAHAEATNIRLGLGMSLVGSLTGGRLAQLERAMDIRSEAYQARFAQNGIALESAQALPVMGAVDTANNTRVNGPVLEILGRREATSKLPEEGFMGRMQNPGDGFDPFVMPDGTRLVWLGNFRDYPGILRDRLETTWNNALGTVLVANPKMDALGLIVMHGAMQNRWAPDATETSPVWRGLGGMMAFSKSVPPARDLAPLLGALGIAHGGEVFRFESLSPEQQAWVNLLGAAEKTNGKALGMTPKWRFIDHALEAIGITGRTGLGGMKAVVLHAPGSREDQSAKVQAVQMMARAARVLGIYISGGDEGTARGPWTDIFAEVAPMNMAGSKNSHPLLQGRYPSEYTGRGVFSAIQHYYASRDLDPARDPVFFQGTGGVGKSVIALAFQRRYQIAGVTEIMASDLVEMRSWAQTFGFRDIPFIWDRKAAEEALDPATFVEQSLIAARSGLTIVNDLTEAVQFASEQRSRRGLSPEIPVVSLNATSHQMSDQRLSAFKLLGVQAVIGGANNMLELDDHGSYQPVAEASIREGVFVPNDSAVNRMGATIVLAKALGIDEAKASDLINWVGAYAMSEYWFAFRKGRSPQVYSDEIAQTAWNQLLTSGQALGGRFNIP